MEHGSIESDALMVAPSGPADTSNPAGLIADHGERLRAASVYPQYVSHGPVYTAARW
jgi:hypothetical protein